jgi:glycosyltransferase involved in cell wall biosynthesis
LLVVCITQLLKDRKIEELLDAARDYAGVYVVLGGKGVLEELVARAAAANPRIRRQGFLSGKAIADYTCAADVVYYGFDPDNPNARFSAPNKLYEALAAGRPLITGDFGEIASVVREAECGIVLPEYSPKEIQKAFRTFEDQDAREVMARNSRLWGRNSMNWDKGEEVLYREYSLLLPGVLTRPARNWNDAAQAAVEA